MSFRRKVKRVLPTPALNFVLLAVPGLYSLPFVQYETNIWEHGGLADICRLLEETSHCPGDVIECGASRCGTSIIMASHIRRLHSSKIVYALDSFRGFPPDEVADERASGLSNISAFDHTSTSLDYVTKKIRKLGYTRYVVPVPGFLVGRCRELQVSLRSPLHLWIATLRRARLSAAETSGLGLIPAGFWLLMTISDIVIPE